MSRHARHRLTEARRPGPPGRIEGSQPVRLASPEAARAELPSPAPIAIAAPQPSTPAVGPIVTPAIPMAAMHAPTTSTAVVDDPGVSSSGSPGGGCTPAQLRRFIKSRAYLPVHEIRRRFGIDSGDDDVTGFQTDSGRIFVGLPHREGRILGDLVRAGEVGYELQLDPEAPVIVGVYPMRPVTRQ